MAAAADEPSITRWSFERRISSATTTRASASATSPRATEMTTTTMKRTHCPDQAPPTAPAPTAALTSPCSSSTSVWIEMSSSLTGQWRLGRRRNLCSLLLNLQKHAT